jgi:hypothetical protein
MLAYLVIGAIAAVPVALARLMWPLSLFPAALMWLVIVGTIGWIVGHAPRGRPLRPVVDDATNVPGWKRWYIESVGDEPARHSCSFIEFDERGDYLDFRQHRDAYQRIIELASAGTPLTLAIYVHGWRHSGQSFDVISFNEFLHQLAGVENADGTRRRVHGVYLVWRGANFRHALRDSRPVRNVTGYYGEPIINVADKARIGWAANFVETFSYFDRKSVPEHKFSGTALSRSIFSCAFAAKRNSDRCEVMLLGHSFGALLLERTFQNAAISQLTEAWPWGQTPADASVNPLPFDSVLLVNSAAPSIYAKQFQGYLAAHRQAMLLAGVPRADTPFVFSITSRSDWATGVMHPIANRLSVLQPTLRRQYGAGDFTLEGIPANAGIRIPQSYYYRHTPGHNPLLVNRFIEPVTPRKTAGGGRSSVHRNLQARTTDLTEFDVVKKGGSDTVRWKVGFPPSTETFIRFSQYAGRRPVVWTKENGRYIYMETAYWIIRCPAEIISSHNAIWTQPAMDVYAALHRIALQANPHVVT